jgi:membrane fusion protein (multidrug efflux system)
MSHEESPQNGAMAERRKLLFTVLAGILALCAVGAGVWWFFVASRSVSTDDAYVSVSTAEVTALTSGMALEVPVHNTEAVKRGDILVVIDPADAKLLCAQADAAYGMTIRKVQGYYAALAARRADFERAKLAYDRRLKLQGTDAISGEELSAVRGGFLAAEAGLQAAEALTQGTSVMNHPEVKAARAALDTAKLNLERTVVRAPVDGIVAQRAVQVGQRVQAGMPVMAVVPISEVYVDANFKEDQLAKVRPGQPVEMTSDLYGSNVPFHGRVAGIGGGTGSAFAIIPAQNATGNWIKVVQRIPVRITLDPDELRRHPLRVGLSMNATIDVSQ